MIYSCFDQPSGLYRYFEDNRQIPVNGDLPVPSYLSSRATKLGVPSMEAGRPLPSDAREIGNGLQARGMVVACKQKPSSEVSGLGDIPLDSQRVLIGLAVAGTAALLWWSDQKFTGAILGTLGATMVLSTR